LLYIITGSARMVWRGPHRKKLRPEDRRCTLIIKNSPENQYLRQKAVRCLADHEIGTHFVSFIKHCFILPELDCGIDIVMQRVLKLIFSKDV